MKRFIPFVLAFSFSLALSQTNFSSAGRTLQSFGVRVERGLPARPYPANVALGLFNPDPLLDLAYYNEGKVQVWQNLGNGTFGIEPVYERSVSGDVTKMQWKKSDMFNEMIFNHMSCGDLYLTFDDGREDKPRMRKCRAREEALHRCHKLQTVSRH